MVFQADAIPMNGKVTANKAKVHCKMWKTTCWSFCKKIAKKIRIIPTSYIFN